MQKGKRKRAWRVSQARGLAARRKEAEKERARWERRRSVRRMDCAPRKQSRADAGRGRIVWHSRPSKSGKTEARAGLFPIVSLGTLENQRPAYSPIADNRQKKGQRSRLRTAAEVVRKQAGVEETVCQNLAGRLEKSAMSKPELGFWLRRCLEAGQDGRKRERGKGAASQLKAG